MAETASAVAHQFDDIEQQREADTLGMWVFLATEILFFGGLFLCYTVYRWAYPDVFAHASLHMNIVLGTINTGILLISSLTMALAVSAAQLGRRRSLVLLLVTTALLGTCFLVITGFEYNHKYAEHLVPGSGFRYEGANPQHAELFFWIYFVMTGLHGLHVLIGVGVIGVLAVLAWRKRIHPENHMKVEVTGLYWHFVDIVWVFLFPLLYLIGHR